MTLEGKFQEKPRSYVLVSKCRKCIRHLTMSFYVFIRPEIEVAAAALPLDDSIYTDAQSRKGATNAVYNPSPRHETRFSREWYNSEITFTPCITSKFELELRLQPGLDTQHAHTLSQLDRGRSNMILHYSSERDIPAHLIVSAY